MTQMPFDPCLEKNQVIDNANLVEIFKCSPQGGMRRSIKTNTLVIVSDHTSGQYRDMWVDGVLHYVGMGLKGDQMLDFAQNKTLKESPINGVRIHLFEKLTEGLYTYRGEVKLVGAPYQKIQRGFKVWIFPIKPI